jgi:hypothetical protein
LARRAGLRLAVAPLERDEPLLEREALLRLRVEAAVFERDVAGFFAVDFFAVDFFAGLLPDAGLLVAISRIPLESKTYVYRVRTHERVF